MPSQQLLRSLEGMKQLTLEWVRMGGAIWSQLRCSKCGWWSSHHPGYLHHPWSELWLDLETSPIPSYPSHQPSCHSGKSDFITSARGKSQMAQILLQTVTGFTVGFWPSSAQYSKRGFVQMLLGKIPPVVKKVSFEVTNSGGDSGGRYKV